jgi:hypothetical protein
MPARRFVDRRADLLRIDVEQLRCKQCGQAFVAASGLKATGRRSDQEIPRLNRPRGEISPRRNVSYHLNNAQI